MMHVREFEWFGQGVCRFPANLEAAGLVLVHWVRRVVLDSLHAQLLPSCLFNSTLVLPSHFLPYIVRTDALEMNI